MNSSIRTDIPPLRSDLVPWFSQQEARMVLAAVQEAQPVADTTNGAEMESGLLRLEVLEVFHGADIRTGSTVQVPYRRFSSPQIRVRNTFDQWNALSIDPGRSMILVLQPAIEPPLWTALAASPVTGPDAPEVDACRKCYAIEGFQGPKVDREGLLRTGLVDGPELLRTYSLDYVGPRRGTRRETAIALIGQALDTPSVPVGSQINLGAGLLNPNLLRTDLGCERMNAAILSTIARRLTAAGSAEVQKSWVRILASVVFSEYSPRTSEDGQIRRALIREVVSPPPDQVVATVTSLLGEAEASEREVLNELLEVWR